MEKEIHKGIIKNITKEYIVVLLDIDGIEQERLFYDNQKVVFNGLEIGDKVTLETIIEGNSMTLNVKKEEKKEPQLILNESREGVGRSYWKENLLENSFIIDTTKETEESFVEKLKEAKGQKEKIILLAGVDFITCPPMITHFMQSGLKATVIVEDIHDIQRGIKTPKMEDIEFLLNNKRREESLKLTEYKPEPIKPDSKKYDYCHGKQPELSFKSGGNNRKTKKRKKAKNGRSKK